MTMRHLWMLLAMLAVTMNCVDSRCMMCDHLNRDTPSSICPRRWEECGNCKNGFVADKLTGNRESEMCLKATVSAAADQPLDDSARIPSFFAQHEVVFSVAGLTLLFAGMLGTLLWRRKICANDPPLNQKITQATQEQLNATTALPDQVATDGGPETANLLTDVRVVNDDGIQQFDSERMSSGFGSEPYVHGSIFDIGNTTSLPRNVQRETPVRAVPFSSCRTIPSFPHDVAGSDAVDFALPFLNLGNRHQPASNSNPTHDALWNYRGDGLADSDEGDVNLDGPITSVPDEMRVPGTPYYQPSQQSIAGRNRSSDEGISSSVDGISDMMNRASVLETNDSMDSISRLQADSNNSTAVLSRVAHSIPAENQVAIIPHSLENERLEEGAEAGRASDRRRPYEETNVEFGIALKIKHRRYD
ncbi:unnamed protein product [Notodromas monacha]|uniref:TNFR-Cys domain-containing protein n=1 Tax=Notodromas monacha TaxID=399045 RepID=A0A7R9BT41_9CRUS|nr:unnamed protein product [Notodromas monacha]CAG0919866.1 unnamed protein product [Notodromas monacha]